MIVAALAYIGGLCVLSSACIGFVMLCTIRRSSVDNIHPILHCPREPRMVVDTNGVAWLDAR